jgi:5-methyltetrahydropteroyltriglutamate--homocysteine methyltransferase
MNSQFHADHIGSFLRPAELLEARRTGVDPKSIQAIEDRHIASILDKQKEIGLDVFTDGEFRRSNFMSDFTDAVEGFDFSDSVQRRWNDQRSAQSTEAPVSSINGIVTSALRQRHPLTGRELPFLLECAPGPIKVTLPSATQFPAISFKYGITDSVYGDPFALLDAVADIMSQDINSLASTGVAYLQIDAPRYSYYLDPRWVSWMERELRVNADQMLTASLAADNKCLAAAHHAGVTRAMHLCRGNNRSHWYAEGGYDAIAERLFQELDVDRFLLEYDDDRSGTFEPLRFVPKEKTVVLGLVSSKLPALEQKQDLLRRINEATRVIPLDRLALSPQCGFASTMEGNLLNEDDQWAKLRLVVEVAREVWG